MSRVDRVHGLDLERVEGEAEGQLEAPPDLSGHRFSSLPMRIDSS